MQISELWTTTYHFWTKKGDFGRFGEFSCIVVHNRVIRYILDSKSYIRMYGNKRFVSYGSIWGV